MDYLIHIYIYKKFYKTMSYMKFIFQFDWGGGLKKENTPSENLNTSDFNEIKIILLMFTGSYDLYLGVLTDLMIGNRKMC